MRTILHQQHHFQQHHLTAAPCAKHTVTSRVPRRRLARTSAAAAQHSQCQVSVKEATSTAELRAAGYLRAYSFYSYPADRSEYAARMHRRMKGDAEWKSVTQKVEGTEPDYKECVVCCFVATIPDDTPIAIQATQDMDPSTKLPADPGSGQGALVVVGSLDVNQGSVLPAEELSGRQPPGGGQQRAYLSNVCTAAAARRQGIAAQIIDAAERWARTAGVQVMYVHVVPDNTPAVELYKRLGYAAEAEETVAAARALGRPRRLLLGKRL